MQQHDGALPCLQVRTASCAGTACVNSFGDEQLAVDMVADKLLFEACRYSVRRGAGRRGGCDVGLACMHACMHARAHKCPTISATAPRHQMSSG